MNIRRPPLLRAAVGAVAILAWIAVADLVLARLQGPAARAPLVQTTLGWVFLLATGGALFLAALLMARRRDRALDQLAREGQRYQQMIEAVADYAVFLLDRDGRIATWNPGAEQITGRTGRDAVGQPLACLCPHDPTGAGDPVRALETARDQGAYSAECRLVRADGTTFWAMVTIRPLRDAHGALTGYVNVTRDISARKAAEAALAAHAEQYRLMFTAHPLPMWVYDLETLRILAVNDAAVVHYGYPRDEFMAMTVRDIRPPEDLPQFIAAVNEVRAGRTITPISRAKVWRHRRKDGSIIHVEITSHVIQFADRRAELVLAHDVTTRLRAEHELEENRARLASIIESAMDAIITVGPDHRVVVFNHAAEEMFGRPAAEMLGQPFTWLLPERLHAATSAWFAGRCLSPGTVEQFAGRRANGHEFQAEASIAPTRTAGGTHFTVVMRDVTQRRRAEHELAESRRLLQVAVDTAGLGFWEYDIDGRAMTVSTEWKRQLGLEQQALSTDPEVLLQLLHPDDLPAIRRALEDLASGSLASLEIEFRARHAGGGYRDIRASAVAHTDAGGRPVRISGTNLDITGVRDAERTVRRLSAHVLRLQDFERRRIARELHDTTAQNLAALNMNLAQLGRALASSDPAHTRLIEETTALADLAVQEIRTLSYVLHPPLLDALGLCRAALDYAEGFAERSGIATSTNIDEFLGRLTDDAEIALFRVLQESLSNVHRHSGAAHAEVSLAIEGDDVALTISDDGHGMDSTTRERLRRRATVGVGIAGMTERLEQLGGTLQIVSSEAGTRLRATVPLEKALGGASPGRQDIPETP